MPPVSRRVTAVFGNKDEFTGELNLETVVQLNFVAVLR